MYVWDQQCGFKKHFQDIRAQSKQFLLHQRFLLCQSYFGKPNGFSSIFSIIEVQHGFMASSKLYRENETCLFKNALHFFERTCTWPCVCHCVTMYDVGWLNTFNWKELSDSHTIHAYSCANIRVRPLVYNILMFGKVCMNFELWSSASGFQFNWTRSYN